MKVNELMIGDWVYNRIADMTFQVYPQFFSQWYNRPEEFEATIQPIPLTPGILEKNGFSGEGYNMGIVGFSVEPIPDKKDGYEVFIWKDMCLQIEHGFTHFKKYIKYVHQLQHALRFAGIEKEIEL